MITQNELAETLGISAATVRNRAKDLGFEKIYKPVPGFPEASSRVFTDDQADEIGKYRKGNTKRKIK